MNKFLFWSICTILVATASLPLYAQSGCQNSPENPTIFLALAGTAGAVFASVRARVKLRK